jgi:hypothetical protein
MDAILTQSVVVKEDGVSYELPNYIVGADGLQETNTTQVIGFLRGSTRPEDNAPSREGTLHEHVLAMLIYDLRKKNELVPSRETSLTITHLEEAMHWLWARQLNRTARNVQGTYQK